MQAMQVHTLNDSGGRAIQFTGVFLGAADSRTGRSDERWSETRIYRTSADRYIMQKIGHSRIYHSSTGCSQGELQLMTDIPSDYVPCRTCKPCALDDSFTSVRVETTRYSCHISETPQGIIESGRLADNDGVLYTPRVTIEALRRASLEDDNLYNVFMISKVE